MITYIIAVILAVLIVITIMHDISIYRLGRKVDILQTFIDVTMRQLEKYALGQKANADQHIQRVEYVGNVKRCRKCKHIESEHQTPISSDGKCYTYVVCTASECRYEPQIDAEEVAKDINRRVEMVKKEWNARHIEDEPQTDCSWK